MRQYIPLLLIILLASCQQNSTDEPIKSTNLQSRPEVALPDSARNGKSYLPVYSQIYQRTERLTFDLTITVSIRNVNDDQTVYLTRIEYYDTKGKLVQRYLDKSIGLAPYETVEIVVESDNTAGGTGDNFVIDWFAPNGAHSPLIQGVMISTAGQQGLSFLTQAIEL